MGSNDHPFNTIHFRIFCTLVKKNRRPISLLSCLGKIYEKILLERLKKFVFTNDLISDEQFGFMPGSSTTYQLTRLMEYITSDFERKMTTIAVFLDISKGYDSTFHTGLIYKLVSMNVPGELITVIDSFFVQRSFRVKMDSAVSGRRLMLARVPQGPLFVRPTKCNWAVWVSAFSCCCTVCTPRTSPSISYQS